MKNGLRKALPEVDIKGLRSGTLFYLEGIRLLTIGHKIAPFTDTPRMTVHRTKTITFYVQEKRERAFYIGPEALMRYSVYDDAGKSRCLQDTVSPPQAVVEATGNLVLQPAEVWKFMQDHDYKVNKKRSARFLNYRVDLFVFRTCTRPCGGFSRSGTVPGHIEQRAVLFSEHSSC